MSAVFAEFTSRLIDFSTGRTGSLQLIATFIAKYGIYSIVETAQSTFHSRKPFFQLVWIVLVILKLPVPPVLVSGSHPPRIPQKAEQHLRYIFWLHQFFL